MACEPPNRAGNPDQEPFSGWGTLPGGSHSITDSRQLQLATPLPTLFQEQRLYHLPALLDPPPSPPAPPLPPAPNQGYTLPYNCTGGAYVCVSPAATQQPEQLTATSSLYKCPVDASTTLPNHMELDDNSELFPLSLIEPSQDDIFAELSPLLPPLPQHQSASVTPVGDEMPLHDLSSPLTLCGNSLPMQLVPSLESSKKSEQSESSASDSVPPLSVGHSESSVIPPGAFIPPSSPLPGDYGFKLHFAKCGTNTPWTFSEALNTLFIKPGDDFAVTFEFATPPPPQCFVRAMVCYGDPVHIQKLGVVTVTPHRNKGDRDSDHSDHFLHCKVPQAVYGEYHTHKCVTVAVDTLPMSECGPFCVYSYACYSGRIVGAGKNKPSLKTIFTVIHDGKEIARDVVIVKCRACPSRDLHKELHGRSKQRAKPGRYPLHGLQKDLHGHPKRQANPDTDPTDGTPRSKRQRRLATDTTTSAVLPQGDDGPPPPPTLPPSSLPLPPTFPGVGVHGVDLVKDEEPDDEGYYNFVWRLKDRGLYNMLLMLRTGYAGCKQL